MFAYIKHLLNKLWSRNNEIFICKRCDNVINTEYIVTVKDWNSVLHFCSYDCWSIWLFENVM